MDAYGQKGLYDLAIAEGEKALELGGRSVAILGVSGFYYALAGRRERAHELLSELEGRSRKGYVSSFWVATIYHGLRETGAAFQWFERAFDERDGNLVYLAGPPPFESLWPDPRYKLLLQKMGLENILEKQESGELVKKHNNYLN